MISISRRWLNVPSQSRCRSMDMAIKNPGVPLRVLLELRPALGGHAGIPQATRLLFRSLSMLEDVLVEGLVQSGERVLRSGLSSRGNGLFGQMQADQQLNRLGRVVI